MLIEDKLVIERLRCNALEGGVIASDKSQDVIMKHLVGTRPGTASAYLIMVRSCFLLLLGLHVSAPNTVDPLHHHPS